MFPKMVRIASAMVMVGGMTAAGVVVASGSAYAGSPVVAPATCAVTGSVNFAAPGLSKIGAVETSNKSTTTATTTASGGCTGTNHSIITSKATVKCKTQPTTAPCTSTVGYVFDNAAGFASSTATLAKAVKKGLVVVDNGVSLTLVPTAGGVGVAQIQPGGACGASDAGFYLHGLVKKSTAGFTATVCLTGDSGPGTTGNFIGDILGGTATVTTATIGGADSQIVIS
jgi:hypothetical protein